MVSSDLVIPGGKVILPLLTLGGIVLWINYYYYGKRPTRRKARSFKEEQKQKADFYYDNKMVHNVKEDYFSQLSDDVLSSILANLTVRDAATTSVLSTRWKILFASLPMLRFQCLDMFGVHPFDHGCCPYYQRKFLKGVSQVLQLYSGHRVAHMEMTFCFVEKFPSEFVHFMRSISRLGVERLCLSFDCFPCYPIRNSNKFKFSLHLLSQASSLKHLSLNDCIVQPRPQVHFISLITLTLKGILLASGQLEAILASCLNLERLILEFCKLPYKLRLTSTATTIIFRACDGVEEIDIQAANLRTLNCFIFYKNVRFVFSFVPMLEYVTVHPSGAYPVSYIFGDFARGLPAQVKSLTIKTTIFEVNDFPIEMKMFRNLKQLSLVLANKYDFFDIVKLSPLLTVCPLLRYLSLVTIDNGAIRGERGSRRSPLSPTCHTELKDVTFCGFQGTEPELDFFVIF